MDNNHILTMLSAAEDVLDVQHTLAESGKSIVSEMLKGTPKFIEWDHYPEKDVKDTVSGAQYYYHAHASKERNFEEHGHFHIFMRNMRLKDTCKDLKNLTHLIAISMDAYGVPKAIFTINHWMSGDIWEDAGATAELLNSFHMNVDPIQPLVNKWINGMLSLYKTEILELLVTRDHILKEASANTNMEAVLASREIEIPSFLQISIEEKLHQLQRLETELNPRAA